MSMLTRLAQHAKSRPRQVAIEGADLKLDYATLYDCLCLLVSQLKTLGVRRLALDLDNGPAWALLDLAALEADVTLLPIPPFFSPAQVKHALSQTAVEMVITDNATGFSRRVPELKLEEGGEIGLFSQRLSLLQTPHGETRMPVGIHKITFTSGTTAAPKGVLLSWQQMQPVVCSLSAAVQVSRDDRHLVLTPLAVLLENIAGLYTSLWCGACVVLPPLRETGLLGAAGLDQQRMMTTLERYAASTAIFSPQMLQGALAYLADGHAVPANLRFIAVGGATVSKRLLEQARQAGLPVYEGYGLSETASVVTLNRRDAHRPGSVGRPLPHIQVSIADDGEVLIKGNRFAGYLGDEPGEEADSWWHTGDIGFLDEDGYLHLQGRRRHIFITAFGRNVSPEWVERELVVEPAIAQAALFGEARPWNLALILPAAGATERDIETAIQRTNQNLPDYARVTQWIVADEPFSISNGQLSGTGRIRREALIQYYGGRMEALYQQELAS
jgi:long-chain acyl-CoA synthetase